jgi:hypothetical protein
MTDSNISYNAIHYIYLKACKTKAAKKLDSAINHFYKKFNGADNFLLSQNDLSASKSQLKQAYIEYALNIWVETVHTYKCPEMALKAIAQSRHVCLDDLISLKATKGL